MENGENKLIRPKRVAWNLCNIFKDRVDKMMSITSFESIMFCGTDNIM